MLFGASVRIAIATLFARADMRSVTVPNPANRPEHRTVEALGKLHADATIRPPDAVTVGPTPVFQVTKVGARRAPVAQPAAEQLKGRSPW
jgi:hypothetical protein